MNGQRENPTGRRTQKPRKPTQRRVSEAVLQNGLDQHQKWLATDKREGKQGDFANRNLRGANLAGEDLRELYLRGCDLEGADLQGADLRGAYLARANLQGANLFGANLCDALLIRSNLERADLQGAKLEGANLNCANLHGAYFFNSYAKAAALNRADLRNANISNSQLTDASLAAAKFEGAILNGTQLQSADLQEADFYGANLNGANLEGAYLKRARFGKPKLPRDGATDFELATANLTNARFQHADLSDADLTGVTSLQSDQLAGAKLLNAKLPKEIAEFKGLEHVEKISTHARNIFLGVIASCAYAWLTIATTTDAALLTNTASTPLPIIQTQVPIAGFYLAAPAALLVIYIYLQIYLQRMWEGLAGLPALFPDGRPLDWRAYPWLLTGFARKHVKLLRAERPVFFTTQYALSVFAAWCLVPFTLAVFWGRYLPRHDPLGTTVLAVFLVTGGAMGIVSFLRARATLRGTNPTSDGKVARFAPEVGSAMALIAILVLSKAAIDSPRLANADLVEANVSERPANWRGEADDTSRVRGAQLRDMDLRHAEGFGAFLVGADLRNSDLRMVMFGAARLAKANLASARLVGAFLVEANLEDANLHNADLRSAEVREAKLKKAVLEEAILEGANLSGANLVGAVLRDANLKDANLVKTNFRGADFGGAVLQGAVLAGQTLQRGTPWLAVDLRGARNLACDQLTAAKEWQRAYRDPALACGAGIPPPPQTE